MQYSALLTCAYAIYIACSFSVKFDHRNRLGKLKETQHTYTLSDLSEIKSEIISHHSGTAYRIRIVVHLHIFIH